MAERPSRTIPAWLAGVPFLFCFVAGQMGGLGGGVALALLLVLLLVPAYFAFATGAPFREGRWSLLPLLGGLAGFGAGTALPTLLRHPGVGG